MSELFLSFIEWDLPTKIYFFLIFLFIWLFYFSFKKKRELKHASQWPIVEGKIIESEVWSSYVNSTANKQKPSIVYEYFCQGQKYNSVRVRFFNPSSNLEDVTKIVERFPKGKIVDVYVHPEKPKLSVLLPDDDTGFYTGFLISIVGILMSLGLFIAHLN